MAAPSRTVMRARGSSRYARRSIEAIHAAARELNAERALALAGRYGERAGREGRAEAAQKLREFEQRLPIKGPDLTREEIDRNKSIGRILAHARKALASEGDGG